jgi:hypothetical protein
VEQYRVFWEVSFDRLDAYLKETAPKTRKKDKPHARKK